MIQRYSSTEREVESRPKKDKDHHKEIPKQTSSTDNLPIVLQHLRKQMVIESCMDSETIDFVLHRKSSYLDESSLDVQNSTKKVVPCEKGLLQKGKQKKFKMKKYEDIADKENKRLRKDMIEDLRENMLGDKYSKMRIAFNHKKIISLGLGN